MFIISVIVFEINEYRTIYWVSCHRNCLSYITLASYCINCVFMKLQVGHKSELSIVPYTHSSEYQTSDRVKLRQLSISSSWAIIWGEGGCGFIWGRQCNALLNSKSCSVHLASNYSYMHRLSWAVRLVRLALIYYETTITASTSFILP